MKAKKKKNAIKSGVCVIKILLSQFVLGFDSFINILYV